MGVATKKQLVSSRSKAYNGTNGRKYITIHETANTSKGADAQAHANLQSNGFSASWHWTVDDKQAIQSFPHTVRCWHAGDGQGNGNLNSIGIEICVNSDGDFKKAVENAVELVKKIMADEGISVNNVVQHNHWSGKNCPANLRSGAKGIDWNDFIDMVSGSTFKPSKPKPSKTKKVTGDVANIQSTVNSRYGFNIAVDNIAGKETFKALVMAYQTELNIQFNAGLVVDGILGAKTRAAGVTVRKGAKGNLTWVMQAMLRCKGYIIAVDGDFGNETEKVVRAFQRDARIGIDGVPGKATFAKLFG